MSSVPPSATVPPPPTGLSPLPWEDRGRLGFGPALLETLKLFFSSPVEAFARTRERGDYESPLIYAVILSWIGTAASIFWRIVMPMHSERWMPAMERFRFLRGLRGYGSWGMSARPGCGGAVVGLILAPIGILFVLFLASAVFHLCLTLVGGLSGSSSGFEGTVRAVAYSSIAQLASVLPVAGGIITLCWAVYLNMLGFVRMHRTTQGKALAAILIPIAVCLVAGIFIVGLLAAIFFSGHRGDA